MKIRQWFALVCGVALFAAATVVAAQAGDSAASTDSEGLARVKSNRFDDVYLLPGADFRGYSKVMLDPTQAAMAKNWLSDMNFHPITLLTRVTAEDGEQIVKQARMGFDDVFSNALRRGGYEIVAAPGAGVLRLSPRVIDLYVRAPSSITQSLPASSIRTANAGMAKLVLEARDSTTGALLWRVADRRTSGLQGNFGFSIHKTTPNSNRFEFGNLFEVWAQTYIDGLDALKAQSPIAAAPPAP